MIEANEGPKGCVRRLEGQWRTWDSAVRNGEKPHDFLPRLSYERLVDLLASGDPTERRYELNIIATEMHNRVVRLRLFLRDVVEAADLHIDEALVMTDESAEAARRSEAAIKRHISVRQDQVEQEPAEAEQASAAAQKAKEAVEEAARAKASLQALDATTLGGAEDPWPPRGDGRDEA